MIGPILVGLSALLTLVLFPFFAYLGLVATAALTRRRVEGTPDESAWDPPRFVVVIPAHNEEAGIRDTVASCLGLDYDPERFTVFVVADNCDDSTAAEARAAGARVVERRDDRRRSKGHALEYFLETTPEVQPGGHFDAVVIIDADTVVDRGLLRAFCAGLRLGWDWMQAYYTARNPESSWRTRLMTYALGLYNGVLPLGQERLGLSVGLKGNGMAFSFRGLSRFPWRAFGLVEDAEFGWMLKAAGERAHFVPTARVYGEMVSQGERAVSQRRRWEVGRRALRERFAGELIRSKHIGNWRKALYLVDLFLPPLVTLLLAYALALAVHPAALFITGLAAFTAYLWPFHMLMGLALVVYGLGPCLALGLPSRYLTGVFYLPYYAFWKYARVGHRPPDGWQRTGRETSVGSGPSN
jgi:cellulose synthase/poly-beta-1,6-N-acetylglucosamine synthase-like glycosyltransferase